MASKATEADKAGYGATQNMEAGTWRLESSNPEHGSWNVDAGTWIQESRTMNLVPSKPFLPNHSIPSNQIGQATEAPFPGEAWFMYLL